MALVKITGYIDAEEYGEDPDSASGLTEEGYENVLDRCDWMERVTIDAVAERT
jgi:hypothetical protein